VTVKSSLNFSSLETPFCHGDREDCQPNPMIRPETKAVSLVQFLHSLGGELHVTLEEGTWAAWLYDVLKPHVSEIVVCTQARRAPARRHAASGLPRGKRTAHTAGASA
jgi:hypothetical protein